MPVRSLAVVSLTFGMIACGEPSPAAPVTQSTPPTTQTPTATRTGVVRDERGTPVAGATVWAMPPGVPVLSDADGRFVAPAVGGMIWIYASKAGYEPDSQETIAATRDLTLRDVIRIPVGGSVRVTVGPNDPWIYVWDQDAWVERNYRIRVVHIKADAHSRVELGLVADDGGRGELSVRNACCVVSPGVLDMAAGTDVEVEIRLDGWTTASRTFTLTASRR